ncbi:MULTISPECIES: phosphatase PAP2 family protein [Myroides]|uniref:Phosphatase PAP2 family protein n=1 Tax=Myroides albus TaxID=2562892 RepID=A0A6I3LFP6_9FLAO|nr:MULTISPECIES: phosphatase PAP2 family protein [Myroides]MTG97278.1 phosphatase PAP2 family protein [Myroides albus]MVX34957.1 phosphatase PAP2 family protein [Myroides sp. LoEW2-1]UVD80635.1 phosphatase PAP2 family protein [Myroides albus]
MKIQCYLFVIILLGTKSFAQHIKQSDKDLVKELTAEKLNLSVANNKNFWDREVTKIALVPTVFFGASAATWHSKEDIREIRNRYIPTFKYKYDDYFQYVPAAATFGLKAAGVQGRNNIKRTTISYATSMAIMAILVNGIKYTAKVERPDGSTKNSFPSGHTAMAFANAAFLDKEYGLVNPAYAIGGYGIATMTGVGRSLNNRHWAPDVLAGAGIGILSTQLAYFFVDKIYGNKGDNLSLLSKYEGNENPSFLSIKVGYTSGLASLVETEDNESLAKMGWEAGLEGAYFFNRHWGIGGQIMVASFPFSEEKLSAPENHQIDAKVLSESMGNLTFSVGPYYAFHFGEKWNLMLKALGGYSTGADGNISLKVRSSDIDIPDLENGQLQIASYKPADTFQFTAGMALTYNITDNLGVTLYSDFNHSQAKMKYTINKSILEEGDSQINTFHQPFNYMSLGFRLTAYF